MEKSWLDIEKKLNKIVNLLNIKEKISKKNDLDKKINSPDFWQNPSEAKTISQEADFLASQITKIESIKQKIKEAKDLNKLANKEDNTEVLNDLNDSKKLVLEDLNKLEDELLFSGKYDNHNVILSIHAGTGGVDAQDWAQMLERMYLRFAEKMNWTVSIIDRILGQEAGIKSTVLKISGSLVYAWLKSEHGVHRLGRISPFDKEALRQTSFALVEVLPELAKSQEVKINDEDIKIDVFRSSGPGGQSVNTSDSAVRITHKPSNIVVSCQSQRSQYQNKQNALNILKAKLYQLKLKKQEDLTKDLKGESIKAKWGEQIRSYILYGKQIVKDHRSQLESNEPLKVLDGNLKEFSLAYLKLNKN